MTPKKHETAQERRERLLARRNASPPASITELAQEEGISRQRIQQIIGKTGHRVSVHHATLDGYPGLVQAYVEGKLTRHDLSERTGLSKDGVTDYMASRGLRQNIDQQALGKQGLRHCCACRKTLPLDAFGPKTNSACKACMRIYARKHYRLLHPAPGKKG